MYRGKMVTTGYGSGYYGNKHSYFVPTVRTFKGRTITEATNKMKKFIREAQITGSFYLRLIQN